jgi:broad specificity phosphatase PhoE
MRVMSDPGPDVMLVRHGETEWSRLGQHTGNTDVELTEAGESQAKALAGVLGGRSFDLVLTSPMRRARQTAELADLTPYEIDDDLREWDYGELEGLTSSQIRERYPDWSIWYGPWPGGETPEQVAGRADRVIRRVLRTPASSVALVAHGHFLRVLAARWLDQPAPSGRLLALDTASVSVLGWEHEAQVLRRWNVTAGW